MTAMKTQDRFEVSKRANKLGFESRVSGAPMLSVLADAPTLARWMQWNDPRGRHVERQAKREGCDPRDLDESWHALDDMLQGACQ